MACECRWVRVKAHVSTRAGSARACGHPARDGAGLVIFPITTWYETEEFNADLSPATDPDRRLDRSTFDTPLLKDALDAACGTPTLTSEDGAGSGDDTWVQLGDTVSQSEVVARAAENAAAAAAAETEHELGDGSASLWFRPQELDVEIGNAENSEGEGTALYSFAEVYFSRVGSLVQVKVHYEITYLSGGLPVGSPTEASAVIPAGDTESGVIELTAPGAGVDQAVMRVTAMDVPDLS
jgi:hypothetical protein